MQAEQIPQQMLLQFHYLYSEGREVAQMAVAIAAAVGRATATERQAEIDWCSGRQSRTQAA